MNRFIIGDRVRVVSGDHKGLEGRVAGRKGIVVNGRSSLWVELDTWLTHTFTWVEAEHLERLEAA